MARSNSQKHLAVYDSEQALAIGLYPDLPPEALGAGMFEDLVNTRNDGRRVRQRYGIATLSPAAPSSRTFMGGTLVAWEDDKVVAITALDNSGTLELWMCEYDDTADTWGSWTQASAGSGKWGNTQMAVPTKGFTQFLTLSDRDGVQGVVVQNGSESPRLIDLDEQDARRIESIPAPEVVKPYAPVYGMKALLDVTDLAIGSLTTSGTNCTMTAPLSNGNRLWKFTFPTASPIALLDYGKITRGSGHIDASDSDQLVLLAKSSDRGWLNAFKISVVCDDGGGGDVELVIHDPSSQFQSKAQVETVDDGVDMIGFPLQEHDSDDLDAVKGIRLTVIDERISDPVDIEIRMIAASGRVPGYAAYAGAWKNSGTRTESPAVKYRTLSPDEAATDLRDRGDYADVTERGRIPPGTNVALEGAFTDSPYFTLPIDPDFYYEVTLPIFAPNSTQLGRGVDTFVIYRKDYKERDYTLAEEVTIGVYDTTDSNGGSSTADRWETSVSVFTGEQDFGARADHLDNVPSYEKVLEVRAPDNQTQPVPIGRAMVYENKRLHVAVERGVGSPKQTNAVMVSEEDRPFRFRPWNRSESGVTDPSSGYLLSFGNEEIVAMKAASSSALGTNVINLWTTERHYLINGFETPPLGSTGLIAADAVAEHDGIFFWVDQHGVVRRMAGVMEPISHRSVSTVIDSVPKARRKWMSGIVYRDRYYLSHAPSGQTNNEEALVWSELEKKWESKDEPPAAKCPQQFVSWTFYGDFKLCFFAPDGRLYEYEQDGVTTDDGAAMTLGMKAGAFTAAFGEEASFRDFGIVAKKVVGTLTTKRHRLIGTGASVDGQMDMNVANALKYHYDEDANGNRVGVSDYGVQPEITGSFSGGFELRKWIVNIEGGAGGGAQRG